MSIILDGYDVPEKGLLEIRATVNIHCAADEARKKVNLWLLNEVSYLMGAKSPTLVVNSRALWRVPAWITFPSGVQREIGCVDVDVETGEMNISNDLKSELQSRADAVASRLPQWTYREAPREFLYETASQPPSSTTS